MLLDSRHALTTSSDALVTSREEYVSLRCTISHELFVGLTNYFCLPSFLIHVVDSKDHKLPIALVSTFLYISSQIGLSRFVVVGTLVLYECGLCWRKVRTIEMRSPVPPAPMCPKERFVVIAQLQGNYVLGSSLEDLSGCFAHS